jgi:hypothetical protein
MRLRMPVAVEIRRRFPRGRQAGEMKLARFAGDALDGLIAPG